MNNKDKILIKEDSLFFIKVINIVLPFLFILFIYVFYDLKTLELPLDIKYIFLYCFIIVFFLIISIDSLFIFIKTFKNYSINYNYDLDLMKYKNYLYIENEEIYISYCDTGNVCFNLKEIAYVELKLLPSGDTRLKIYRRKIERSILDKIFDLYLKSYIIDIEIGELDKLLDLFNNYSIEINIVKF